MRVILRRQLRETLRCALGDTALVRATPMPSHVAQSAAKGLLMLAVIYISIIETL